MYTISATPYDYTFRLDSTALVIIDMQRDFIEVGGFGAMLGNDVTPLASIIPNIERLLRLFRQHGMRVVHTQEGHRPDLADCPPAKLRRGNPALRIGDQGPLGRILIQGAHGYQIIPPLAPLADELVIAKPGKGAFYNTGLQDALLAGGITHLLFTGVTTEVCVQTTMREANDRGYECLLINDATESYFPNFKTAVLEMITAQGGIVGWHASTADVVEAIEHAAGGPIDCGATGLGDDA